MLNLSCDELLSKARLTIVGIASKLPFEHGRISQLKQLDKYYDWMHRLQQDAPEGTSVEIDSITYAYAFADDASAHVASIIGQLFGFQREPRELAEQIRSSSRHSPALSSGRIGLICSDSRLPRFGDTLICADLPSDIDHIYLHYFRATPSSMVICLQCSFRNGGRDLLKSAIASAKTRGIPVFSIRQLVLGKGFQCSVRYKPHPIRDSLHSTFSKVGELLERWLTGRVGTSIKNASAKSIVPAFKASTTGPPSNDSINKWISENRRWLANYGLNGWDLLQYSDDNSVVDTVQCVTDGWRIYFTLLLRESVDMTSSANSPSLDPREYRADYSLALSFFGATFSILHQCAESFEKNRGKNLMLAGKSKLLSRSREKLVTSLHAQKEYMRMFSHDVVARKSIIAHFCHDLAELKPAHQKGDSLLLLLLKGLQSEAADIHQNQAGIVSGIADAIGLKNIYSTISLQRTAVALACISSVLALLQIAPIACGIIDRYPKAPISRLGDLVCPAFSSDASKI